MHYLPVANITIHWFNAVNYLLAVKLKTMTSLALLPSLDDQLAINKLLLADHCAINKLLLGSKSPGRKT